MIRVTVEMVPFGIEAHKRIIGTAIISNDGTGDHLSGNYKVSVGYGAKEKWKKGTVKDFPRKRLNAWHLLSRALNNVLYSDTEGCKLCGLR